MQIGFFGDGCLGLDERIRDGVTVDRLGWISELEKLGHVVSYYSHRSKVSVNLFSDYLGKQFCFEQWKDVYTKNIQFPELDVLVIESRTRIFGAGGSIFLQYLFLKHYMKTSTIICFWDFDIGNTASIVGTQTIRKTSRLNSIYANKPYEITDPEFYNMLQEQKSEFIYLMPYALSDCIKKQFSFAKHLHMFTQGVNEDFYNSIEFSNTKTFDMIYNGSDYNRRQKFKDFYGDWSNEGFRIGITGVWNKKKGGEEFLKQFPEIHQFGYLSTVDVYTVLNKARVLIEIAPSHYIKHGNFTQRCVEGVFSNVITFIDAEIKDSSIYFMPEFCINKQDVGDFLDEIFEYQYNDYINIVNLQKEYFLDNNYSWKHKVVEFLNIIGE